MYRMITSASVFVQDGMPAAKVRPKPGINILWGKDAEYVFWSIAGIFAIYPKERPLRNTAPIQADICRSNGIIYVIYCEEHIGNLGVFVNYITPPAHTTGNTEILVKQFHKCRFWDARDKHCIFDGTQLDRTLPMGESDLLLHAFYAFLRTVPMQDNAPPLFLCNFWERLDEGIDPRPIILALSAIGRQVFIAVPHYCEIKAWEEFPYDTAIHTI